MGAKSLYQWRMGADIHAIKEGYISVTPIKLEFLHNTQAMKDLLDTILEKAHMVK